MRPAVFLLALAGCTAPAASPKEPVAELASPPLVAAPRSAGAVSAATTGAAPAKAMVPLLERTGVARGDASPADALLAEGDAELEGESWEKAMTAFQGARGRDAKNARPLVGLARAYLGKDKIVHDVNGQGETKLTAKAEAALREAAALDPGDALPHLDLGRLLLVRGDAPRALEELRRAVELGEKSSGTLGALGVALVAVGRADEAIPPLARAAELDPTTASHHGNLGKALLSRGRTEEAIVALSRATTLDPDNPRTLSDLGAAFLAAELVDRAIPLFERSIAKDAKRPAVHTNLAFARIQKGDLAGGVASAKAAIALDAGFASAWINLGIAQARLKQFGDARKSFLKAEALDGSDPRPKVNLKELAEMEATAKAGRASPRKP